MKAEAVVTTAAGTVALVGLVSCIGAALGIGIGGQNSHGDFTYYYRQIGDFVTKKFSDAGKSISDSGVLDFIENQSNGDESVHVSDELAKATYEGFNAVFPEGDPISGFHSDKDFAKLMHWDNYGPNTGAITQKCWGEFLHLEYFTNVVLVHQYTGAQLNGFNQNGLSLTETDNSSGYSLGVSNSMGSYFTSSETYTDGHFFYINAGTTFAEVTASDPANNRDVWMLIDSAGNNGFVGYKSTTGGGSGATTPQKEAQTTQPYVPSNKGLYAEGHSVLTNSYDDVMAKIKSAQGTLDGINLKISSAVKNMQAINDAVKAQTQSQVLGRTIADEATDAKADEAANTGRDTTVPQNPAMPNMMIPSAITRKFPFSIPWDLYNSVTILASPGEAPCWTLPIKNSAIGLDYTMRLDMSQFNVLAAVLRWGLSLVFLIGLILLTNKVIKH